MGRRGGEEGRECKKVELEDVKRDRHGKIMKELITDRIKRERKMLKKKKWKKNIKSGLLIKQVKEGGN